MNPLKVLTYLSWEISPQLWNPEQMKLNFLISVFKPCCHFSWRINWSNCSELSPSSRDCSLCFHYVKSSTRWRCCSSVLTCYCMYCMDSLFAWEHGKNQIVRMPVVHIKFLICKKTKNKSTENSNEITWWTFWCVRPAHWTHRLFFLLPGVCLVFCSVPRS